MASSQQSAAAAAAAAAADHSAPQQSTTQPLTESAKKKAEKAAEKAKEKAAKFALKQEKQKNQGGAAATAGGAAPKKKPVKQAASEPEWHDKTVPGQKKDLSAPMESGYNPAHVESSWQAWWESSQFYTPAEPSDKDPHDPKNTFVIPAPPPNVTGALHIGHGLTVSIQDTLVRWYRMRGFRVLFCPGYDHAGISTQAVVEKRLLKSEGKTRHDYGREEFLRRVFQWKDEYKARIANQLRRLGVSYDFTREAFTMDEVRSKAVTEAFCRLHEEGIIYRGSRLVNWCCYLNTSLSNLEVEQKQLDGRTLMNVVGYPDNERVEFGVITSFAYKIIDSDERIVVATTRPETMLGDTAVAVHPNDERYKHLHGKLLEHPFIPGRHLPIITDAEAVDMEFGTGAVKITPAHDPNDYEVGVRHKLEFINILNDDGTLNENAGEFKGVRRFHARRSVIEALKSKGLYVETKDNPMTVPICSRSGDIVEPVIKPQWWVNCGPLAKNAVDAVKSQNMKIFPATSDREFHAWMERIQDWCISRQLWWGHRCPAYLVKIEGETTDASNPASWVVGRTEEQAHERAARLANGAKYTLEQDEDVLDTWFSSGLWPFSILGWPEKTPDMDHFYPNSMLETGWDITFFWVARMVMLGVHFTGTVPFHEVFCHAMVRDAHGRKMSKSLGNVIDPLDVVAGISLDGLHEKLHEGNLADKEIAKAKQGQKKDFPKGIPQCGTDALRFALCAYTSAGRDINLDILRVEGYRKFCNKLWNATKFALLKLEPAGGAAFEPAVSDEPTGKELLVEKWILHRLDEAVKAVHATLEARNFMAATEAVYSFWLYELCDVYIEAIKPVTDASAEPTARLSAQQTLYTALDAGLKLLHPFMPFVTEELWQRLPRRPQDSTSSISVASFPKEMERRNDAASARDFDDVFAAVKGVRGLADSYGIISNIQVYLEPRDASAEALFRAQSGVIETLVKGCKSVSIVPLGSSAPTGCAISPLSARLTAHLLIAGQVDVDSEIEKLTKKLELATLKRDRDRAPTLKEDWSKTPEEVRRAVEGKIENAQREIEALEEARKTFQKIGNESGATK